MKILKRITEKQIWIGVGVLSIPAYFLVESLYKMQIVYAQAHLSKETFAWLILLLGWGYISDKIAVRMGGKVKRNGWIIYIVGTLALLIYVLS